MNGERTPGTKNDDSSEFHAQDENNSKKRFSSMREGVSGVLVDVRTDRPPEIENGQEENMIDEKKLIAKLEDMAKESKEESGLKEPVLLQKIIEEVKDMAVNEEIKARIERENASGALKKYDPYSLLGEIVTCEVQVTLRSGDHIGRVWFKHMGDRVELSAFGFDFKDIDHEDDVPHNDCDLSYSERFDGFCAELKNDKGDIESIKEESAGFMNSLVASIEITDCYKEKSCYTCGEWEPGFERCRHPDQPQSLADDYMAPRDHCCDLWMAKG